MAGEPLSERLARLEERHAALQAHVTEALASRDHALGLQAREVERRLGDLNHEAARITAAAALSVNADVYAANRAADQLLFTGISKQLDTDTGRGIGWNDARIWLAFAVGLVIAIATYLAR